MRENPTQTELDQATQARLARLAAMPVDTSRLDKRLRSMLADHAPEQSRWRMPQVWRPLTALAAALLLVATVGVLIMSLGDKSAQAAPMDLARLHAETTKSDAMATTVTSIEEANRVLAGQWSDLPKIPAPAAGELHACCIHDFMDRKVVCLLLRDGETPLTLVVGRSRDFRCATGQVVERGGRKFTLHVVNGLNMAMSQQDDRFICLMGELPQERLLKIAAGLKF